MEILRALVVPGETWLDIGAGGGRCALPLAQVAGSVIAIEPAASMRVVLESAIAEHHATNVQVVDSRWPVDSPVTADVAFISHVGYDIEEIGPFLDAMERSARRLCVAVLLEDSPPAPAAAFWPAVHGEERCLLPALPEFLMVQLARGRQFEVRLCERPPAAWPLEGLQAWLRQQLFVTPGSDRDRKLMEVALPALEERDGRWATSWRPKAVGIVSWSPPQ